MEEIKSKANYCLNCVTKPCSNKGCPLNNNIPGFIKAIKEENYKQAYEILSETTVLESVCGRICPHTKQCQGSCVRGIKGQPVSIGELEAFVGDIAIKEGYKFAEMNNENKNKKIAIVGGGPAGLTASAFLLKKGYSVTIFEKYDFVQVVDGISVSEDLFNRGICLPSDTKNTDEDMDRIMGIIKGCFEKVEVAVKC